MTRELTWMGLLATLIIVVVVSVAVMREPSRQDDALIDLRIDAVTGGTDLFAVNCAVCHGASGEGLGATPPLNSAAVRDMDYDVLTHTIERGRYNTVMAAYSVNEGGILTNAEIENLVAVIQYANWQAVAARVDALGLTPSEPVVVEVTDDMLASVSSLPGGETLSVGLQVFATECVACHGANGEGTTLAPVLNSAEVRARLTDADITRTIEQGVPGTLMASWRNALSTGEIAGVVEFIRRWEEVDAAGVTLPTITPEPIEITPELIAQGQWLFNITCSQCHGTNGYGTSIAPALNNQTFLSETPDVAIQQIIEMGVPDTVMPAWGGWLSETDITSLVAYLRSLEPTAPAIATSSTGTATGTGTGTGAAGGGPPWRRN
jgi:mono/diheme cytochrome c family protein